MKKIVILLLVLGLAVSLLCPAAMADEPVAGRCISVTGCRGGFSVSGDPDSDSDCVYLQNRGDDAACRCFYNPYFVTVSCSGVTEGATYICYVLTERQLPDENNIFYMAQNTASGTDVEFFICVDEMAAGTYYVYLTGEGYSLDNLARYSPAVTLRCNVGEPVVTLKALGAKVGENASARIAKGIKTPIWQSTQTVSPVRREVTELQWWNNGWQTGDFTVSMDGFVSWAGNLNMSHGNNVTLVRSGDVNGDGMPTNSAASIALDMQCLYEYLSADALESNLQEAYFLRVADVNGNSAVDILDYQYMFEQIH